MKLAIYRAILSASVIAIVLGTSPIAQAQSVEGNTISWPAEGWFQVQHEPTQNWDVCNSTDDGTSCIVPPGTYVVINHQTGERSDNVIVLESGLDKSFRQTREIHPFGTADDARGGAVMTRSQTEVSARLSMMDLDENAAYSVWWVIFNEPSNCLSPNACGENDIFSAPGVLNAGQIPAAGGPDANSGLMSDNGSDAEIHLVIRTHGPAVAGSVWMQTTTSPRAL